MTATKSKEEVIPLGGVSRRVGAGYCESLTVDTLAMARGRESPSCSRPDMSAIVTRFDCYNITVKTQQGSFLIMHFHNISPHEI